MRTGITFKNKHSSAFNVTVRTKSRSFLPEVKRYTYDTPLMNGQYDFSAANVYGHEFYSNRVFTVTITVLESDVFALQKKLSVLGEWLRGCGELKFDDMPYVKWNARVVEAISSMPEIHGRKAVFDVNFEVEPFSSWVYSVQDGIKIGDDVEIGLNVPIGLSALYEDTIKKSGAIKVYNAGTWYVKPIITILSNNSPNLLSSPVTLTYGSNKIEVDLGSHPILDDVALVIDCENQTISAKSSGMNRNLLRYSKVTGNFFDLPPGESVIGITIDTTTEYDSCKVTVEYVPRFFYDYDYETEWGVGDA